MLVGPAPPVRCPRAMGGRHRAALQAPSFARPPEVDAVAVCSDHIPEKAYYVQQSVAETTLSVFEPASLFVMRAGRSATR